MATQAATRPTSLDRALTAGNWPVLHPRGYWLVESSTTPGLDHTVRTGPTCMSCTCLASRDFGRDCKHQAAVRYCIANHIRGVFLLCGNCKTTRVAKPGLCRGCQNLADEVASAGPAFGANRRIMRRTFCAGDTRQRSYDRSEHAATIKAARAAGIDPLADAFE